MMTSEAEIWSMAKVTTASSAALSYCYVLLPRLPVGMPRVVALLPVIYLFTVLPLCFSSVHLRSLSSFFLVWLATFKLLLLAFHKGPLAIPGLSLPVFLALTAFPIKLQQHEPGKHQEKKQTRSIENLKIQSDFGLVSFMGFTVKGIMLGYVISQYRYWENYSRGLVTVLCGLHIYVSLELILAIAALASRTIIGRGLELEPQFAPPYLSTSLQDFWSRRWNLMVTRLLHLTVYDPVRVRCGPFGGVMAAFLVSGLMHEIMFYYLTLQLPTGEVTCFFILHGLSTAAEVALKALLRARGWKPLPRAIAAPLTVGYVFITASLLFFPPLMRSDALRTVVPENLAVLIRATAGRESVTYISARITPTALPS